MTKLMLKRKAQESVTITTTVGTIVITVVNFRCGAVNLLIEAPREIGISRTELIEKGKIDDEYTSKT